METFKIDDVVYVNGAWLTADKCKIVDIENNYGENKETMYKIQSLDMGGTYGALYNQIFTTKEKAVQAAKENNERIVNAYKDEIKTLKDLLEFPIATFCSEDYEAVRAYKEKVKEIVGIDI